MASIAAPATNPVVTCLADCGLACTDIPLTTPTGREAIMIPVPHWRLRWKFRISLPSQTRVACSDAARLASPPDATAIGFALVCDAKLAGRSRISRETPQRLVMSASGSVVPGTGTSRARHRAAAGPVFVYEPVDKLLGSMCHPARARRVSGSTVLAADPHRETSPASANPIWTRTSTDGHGTNRLARQSHRAQVNQTSWFL